MTEAENRELAERLGICWHEVATVGWHCSKCHAPMSIPISASNPDFTSPAGIVLLLNKMKEREDFKSDFIHVVGTFMKNDWSDNGAIPIDLITDTTGKLAQEALDWLRKSV